MNQINNTQAIILGILKNQPLAGCDIAITTTQLDGHWNVTRSQVYRELPKLADLGLVLAGDPISEERWKQPYFITDMGSHAYDEWFRSFSPKATQRDPWTLRVKLAEMSGDTDPELTVRAAEYFQILSENEEDSLLRELNRVKSEWFRGNIS